MAKIDLIGLVKANAVKNADRVQSEEFTVTVTDIVPAQSVTSKDGVVLEKVRVITKEYGSMWAFKTSIINALTNYGAGVQAKATVVPNVFKNAEGVEQTSFNLQRLVIQAIDSKVEAAISKMPAGTALFASAGAL